MPVETRSSHPSALQAPEYVPECFSADVILSLQKPHSSNTEKVILIGASTGGTEAIKEVLVKIPAHSPAILITQHMPQTFTRSFAHRLDTLCAITVNEAVAGMRVLPGNAYIAPGQAHLMLARDNRGYFCELSAGPPVNRHRPSVDVLFRSGANCAGKSALGIILTGMGKDGARGMLELHQAGAFTLAQDEASCVVYGMPKEAVAMGGVSEIVALKDIVKRLLSQLHHPVGKT